MSKKAQTVHDGPGLAHMANYRIDFEAIYKNRKKVTLVNQSRKMPLSVARYELNDLNGNGDEELFLLGDLEDGRGKGKYKNEENMKERNFIYDFERDRLLTFGPKSRSHDYGIHDLNNDGFKEIFDLTRDTHGFDGKTVYFYCDGKTLKCRWFSTEQFINGNSFMAYDAHKKKLIMNARCGRPYSGEGFYGKFELCWFDVQETSNGLTFSLINKFKLQAGFNAKIRWQSWFGYIKLLALRAWKIDNYPVNERVRKSAGGTATAFRDLDKDGDLDMITYRKDLYCVKKNKKRNYYNYEDCDQFTHFDYIFTQEKGKFEFSQVIEGGIRDGTKNYDFEDLNKDGYLDIIPRGVYFGKCVDTYENVLINNGDGTFNRTNEKFSGRYGCELASNFFEHDGQRYRVFTFKPEVKEHTFFDYDVYLAIEKLN